MPLHTQAGDTTAVATSRLSLTSTPSPREPFREGDGHHPFPLDGRSPDMTGGVQIPGLDRRLARE